MALSPESRARGLRARHGERSSLGPTAGKSVYEQGPAVSAHLVAMRKRYDEGALLLGGPFERGGGIAMLDVPDEAAGRALMDSDPAVQAGVMVYELHRMRAYFDAFAGVRTLDTVESLEVDHCAVPVSSVDDVAVDL